MLAGTSHQNTTEPGNASHPNISPTVGSAQQLEELHLSPPVTQENLHIVSLNYGALTTPVLPHPARFTPARRMHSYDRRHVDMRESRVKKRYKKLNQKYQHLEKRHQQLNKKCRQQQTEIKYLKAQLAKTRSRLAQKMTLNQRNLKRVGTLKYTARNKARHITEQTSDKLHLMQENLQAERTKVEHMKEKLQLDDEYCELEKYREAKGKVDEFIEGTSKYIPHTKEGQKFTKDIRTLYYRLLAEQIPSGKIEKSIKIVLESMCPHIDVENMKLPKTSLANRMRSSELPTVSKAHQASILSTADHYHRLHENH